MSGRPHPSSGPFTCRNLQTLLAKIADQRLVPAACGEYVTVIPKVSTKLATDRQRRLQKVASKPGAPLFKRSRVAC
jgi:hypothetical protein